MVAADVRCCEHGVVLPMHRLHTLMCKALDVEAAAAKKVKCPHPNEEPYDPDTPLARKAHHLSGWIAAMQSKRAGKMGRLSHASEEIDEQRQVRPASNPCPSSPCPRAAPMLTRTYETTRKRTVSFVLPNPSHERARARC